MALLFHSKNIGETGFNWLHLNDSDPDLQKQLDDLLDAGDNEPDQDKRKDIYIQIQQLISKNHLFVALKYDALLVMLKEGVNGWRMNDLGFQPRYYDISIEKS
jgi:ABC-type transport system substrate-binding protein